MGIPTELFTSTVADNRLCAVCHDCLEDPYSLVCGHTFCHGCIDDFRNDECPTCRKDDAKPTAAPAFALRDIIGELQVRCKHCAVEDDDSSTSEPAAKRQKVGEGDDDPSEGHVRTWWKAVVRGLSGYRHLITSSEEQEDETKPSAKRPRDGEEEKESETTAAGCDWVGKLSEWDSHAKNECQLHPIRCSVQGCTVRCPRKNMQQHMEDSMLAHVNLIADAKAAATKAAFDRKLGAMQRSHNEKVATLQNKVTELETSVALQRATAQRFRVYNQNATIPPSQIFVENAGEPIVNGRYVQTRGPTADGSYQYYKECELPGQSYAVYILKLHDEDGRPSCWIITMIPHDKEHDYNSCYDLYSAPGQDVTSTLPPRFGWTPAKGPVRSPSPVLAFCG